MLFHSHILSIFLSSLGAGDDMGLGKTVQMVSLIAALQKKTGTALDMYNIQSHRTKALKVCR